MRYGTFDGDASTQDKFIFYFLLTEENGELKASQRDAEQPEFSQQMFIDFWERIQGIKKAPVSD